MRDFPGGPVVKNLPQNAGGMGLIPSQGVKIPYVCVQVLNRVQLSETPWPVAHQAALSMGFPRQEYWNGLPFPSPGYLSNPGIKPVSPRWQADSLPSEPPGKPLQRER